MLINQLSLTGFYRSSPPRSHISPVREESGFIRHRRSLAPLLSFVEARDYAYSFMASLPLGSEFTSYAVFEGVGVRFDRRKIGLIIRELLKEGLIAHVGVVRAPRENGNPGIRRCGVKFVR